MSATHIGYPARDTVGPCDTILLRSLLRVGQIGGEHAKACGRDAVKRNGTEDFDDETRTKRVTTRNAIGNVMSRLLHLGWQLRLWHVLCDREDAV